MFSWATILFLPLRLVAVSREKFVFLLRLVAVSREWFLSLYRLQRTILRIISARREA